MGAVVHTHCRTHCGAHHRTHSITHGNTVGLADSSSYGLPNTVV
jgi:hypothetical protein